MEVTELRVHPVKSTAVRPVGAIAVGRSGLRGDRTWMVVDRTGAMVSARELPELFRITADTPDTSADCEVPLRLRADGRPDLVVPVPDGTPVPVTMFGRVALQAVPAGPAADAWVRAAVGLDGLSLVWCDDPTRRRLDPAYTREGDHTAFADGYPVTLASEASLARLQGWIDEDAGRAEPVPMTRFRPNVVVTGAEAFAEDDWHRIRIGEVPFRVVKGVDRCRMTLVDPDSLARGREPLRTLGRRRRWDRGLWFCRHLVPDGDGMLRVGDRVVVED